MNQMLMVDAHKHTHVRKIQIIMISFTLVMIMFDDDYNDNVCITQILYVNWQ